MSVMLVKLGAEVIGYSTCSVADERLFDLSGIQKHITHVKGDVRDLNHLASTMKEHQPEIIIHMAAQPIVREGYKDPVRTYSTNVMGTVNLLEAVRHSPSGRSVVNVTTDKVYLNREWEWGYRECEELDGYDPYSNSKSCSELVTRCYRDSFFGDRDVAVSTARAGNVIGGGDFACNRIIPDCVRAAIRGEAVAVRNPSSIRPYQHVLEPVCAYLAIAAAQYGDERFAGCYNVGPDEGDCLRTGELVRLFARLWGEDFEFVVEGDEGPHEAVVLKLDCSRMKSTFDWRPRWSAEIAVEKTVEWTKAWIAGENVRSVMEKQIEEYLDGDLNG